MTSYAQCHGSRGVFSTKPYFSPLVRIQAWAADRDGWLSLLHGEILAKV